MTGNKKETIGNYLSIVYRALNSLLDMELEKHDISRGQFPYLIALYHQEGVSQQDLCDFYNFDKAAAVRAIKTLETKKFIERDRDPEDRRQYKIYLTKKGKMFKPVYLDILKYSEDVIKKDLSSAEINQFILIMKKIIINLENEIPNSIGVDL